MQFYIKSKPISVGVSVNDRLNYIAYILGKDIKYPDLSPFHGLWQLYFNRVLFHHPSKKRLTDFFVCFNTIFLESKTHQLNFEGLD